MIARIIRWSASNLVLVLIATLLAAGVGFYAVTKVPLDAIPDLSDTQVIVYTEYTGQAPQVVEDQVTYPLTTAMLSVPRSKVVRGFSFFGVSFVYVIFEEGTDIYWARSRVLEYLSAATRTLPQGVVPTLGPDATGVGWVYQYAVVAQKRNLAELRTTQDWQVRFAVAKAEGVAEVASVGGFVRQYSVIVDPRRLRAFNMPLSKVRQAIRESNLDVGGRVVELAETEFMVRGRGYLKGIEDIEQIVLKAEGGTPVLVKDVARVELAPDERRGVTELNGEGEVVSGIAVQRYGQNALSVIGSIKDRLADIKGSLPEGTEVVPVYDRSDLIHRAIANLKTTLLEESAIVALVCIVFLLHVRSALVAIITLPLGILIAYTCMWALGISSNRNPINRALIRLYRPIIRVVLRAKAVTIAVAVIVLAVSVWPATRLGSEFMPTLNEGTIMYMPTTLPGLSITKSAELLQIQNRIIKTFPEVLSVFGKAGRAATATDPAPTEMFETVINLKPEREWRPGVTIDSLIKEMDKALQFPGVSNAWTMPIKARIDMLATGIRTPVGVKVIGLDLSTIEKLSREIEAAIKTVPGTSSAFAERIIGGYYLDIEPDRRELARYGLMVGDVQQVVASALGAETVTTTVEGRERYGVSVRYPRDVRSDPQAISREVLVPLPNGASIPLGQIAKVSLAKGPASIRTENAQLAAYIFVDARERDLGSYVADAKQAVAASVQFPPGYYAVWSGQYEYYERAKKRLAVVVPLTLLIIVLLLYLNFRRMTETLIVLLSLPFALVGGLWLMWWMGFNLSVAVAVGFIALAGVAAETGVIMLIYLDHAWVAQMRKAEAEGRAITPADLTLAIMEGAVERVRPKMMTVIAIMAGLLPILWSHGTGSEVMQRIAVPMIGGMISSTVLTLVVIPAIYAVVKGWGLSDPSACQSNGGTTEAATRERVVEHA